MRHGMKFSGRSRDAYLDLVKQFPLTSIRSDAELAAAQDMLDRLLNREPLDDGEDAYLEALSDLIAIYESEHVELGDADDSAVLRHLIEANGLSQSTLASDTKISKSTISEVLAGKRKLTRPQIAALSLYFSVAQGTFTYK